MIGKSCLNRIELATRPARVQVLRGEESLRGEEERNRGPTGNPGRLGGGQGSVHAGGHSARHRRDPEAGADPDRGAGRVTYAFVSRFAFVQ